MKTLLAILLATLALAVPASAATVYWTPEQMARLAPTLPGPLYQVDNNAFLTNLAAPPVCVGIGTAQARAFPGFRCSVSWKKSSSRAGKGTLWVRPQTRGYCVSSTAYASCPESFRPDDPRVCRFATASTASHYAEYCMTQAARLAIGTYLKRSGVQPANLGCAPMSALVARCAWLQGKGTVTYRLDGTWKATFAIG